MNNIAYRILEIAQIANKLKNKLLLFDKWLTFRISTQPPSHGPLLNVSLTVDNKTFLQFPGCYLYCLDGLFYDISHFCEGEIK